MNKVKKGLFITTSNEVLWPPKKSTFMHGLKIAIFQKSADWLDWPVSVALHFRYQIFFLLLFSVLISIVVWSFRSRSKQCDKVY